MEAVDAGRFKLHLHRVLLREGIREVGHSSRQLAVFLDTQQNVGRSAPIGDEHRPVQGGFLGFAGRLIEFSTRHGYHGHGKPQS